MNTPPIQSEQTKQPNSDNTQPAYVAKGSTRIVVKPGQGHKQEISSWEGKQTGQERMDGSQEGRVRYKAQGPGFR